MKDGWEDMAAWWDDKQGDDGDLWHRALIDPTVLRVLGPVADLRVLDLGCGNGYLARRLARLGATVTGIDASEAMVARAQARERQVSLGITYLAADAASLDMLAPRSFDVVLSNMALMDIADAAGAIREAGRVLRPGGRLVASLSHPCFDVPHASGWVVERMDFATTVWRKVGRYRETFEGSVPWDEGSDRWHTPAYHRPLSWYVRAFRASRFVVTAFEEPEPTPEFMAASSSGPWIAEIPLHCVFEAVLI